MSDLNVRERRVRASGWGFMKFVVEEKVHRLGGRAEGDGKWWNVQHATRRYCSPPAQSSLN